MFKTNTAAAPPNQDQAENTAWKAQGFINLYLPSENGGRKKLGAIPLKMAKKNERQLLEWLMEDPTRVNRIASQIQMDFQAVDQGSGFKLED